MGHGRNLQMAYVLSHTLGPLPWALATPEGLYRKTNKAALASYVQTNVAPVDQLPDHSAIDVISIIQKVGLKLHNITRTQIVRQWRSILVHVGKKSSLISFMACKWGKLD